MWKTDGTTLMMAEDDFGVALTVRIKGVTLSNQDAVRITIKDKKDGNVILSKEYTEFSDNSFGFSLTESESGLLAKGSYVYLLDWYQSGSFMCNIIEHALFKVVDKA